MDDLNEQREKRGIDEKRLLSLFASKEKERQQSFDSALIQEFILDYQFDTDALILSTKLTEWHNNKSASKKQKKVIMEMLQSLWRMQTYKETLKIISKGAVSHYVEVKRENNNLRKQTLADSKTIKAMKNEIDYYGREAEKENKSK